MNKTCVKLGLKECYPCSSYKGDKINSRECWVDFYKKCIMSCRNKAQIKQYIIREISSFNKLEWDNYLTTAAYYIDYIKAAAFSVSPEYLSFINKMLLLM